MTPNSGLTYLAEAGSDDIAVQIKRARVMRAQAAADLMNAGLSAIGPLFRPLSRRVARWRELSALRRSFAGLDPRTLRDLGLSPQLAAEITPEALADHPMAVPGRWQVANENATRRQDRSAA
ncbi:MAG: DUF1127 domain-containing protein [Sneathiellaceae bacterium]